ncbi:hypothetical protein G7046_g3871 [Stylonectria norvegica]|nr:hypothetical protein G7046_g3871 [Stylonectria norvegica]
MAPLVETLDLSNTKAAYYSPATIVRGDGRLIHIAGQAGSTKSGKVPSDYESQIHLALLNLRKIIIAAGASVRNIAKLTIYIVNYDPAHRKHTRHIQRFLAGHRPAMTLVPVAQLAVPGWLFEVDAVVALGNSTSLPQAVTLPEESRSVDVVIIGAGLSGLTAAQEVIRAGLSCVVLEGRDRVGGKTWSQTLSGGKGVVELGAAWINDVNQTKMISLARRFELELIEQNTEGNVVFQEFDGKPSSFPYGEMPKFDKATSEDVVRIRDKCEADCQTLDIFRPEDTHLDSLTFEAYIKSLDATKASLATATVWTRAMLGVEPADVSALFFLNYCKSGGGLLQMRSDRKGGGQHLRVREGLQSISQRIAADLPKGTVLLGNAVEAVLQEAPHSTVVRTKAGRVYLGHKVITTVPSPVLKTIRFEPPLHPMKLAWSSSAGYGYYTKAMMVFKVPFWIEQGFCGLVQSFVGPAAVIRDTSSPADDKHVLTCFVVGSPASAWAAQPSEDREKGLLGQISTLFGRDDLGSQFVEMITSEWMDDEFAGYGCPCASLAPGVLDTLGPNALREPVGNLYFAGTETAGEWKGYMEGAVRSGERAAGEVLKDLKNALTARL